MTSVVLATSLESARVAAAAVRAGAYERPVVLLTAECADVPELADRFDADAQFAQVAAVFDRVVDLNVLIWPQHPLAWRETDLRDGTFTERFAAAVGSLDVDGLTIEVPPTAPGRVLRAAFPAAEVSVLVRTVDGRAWASAGGRRAVVDAPARILLAGPAPDAGVRWRAPAVLVGEPGVGGSPDPADGLLWDSRPLAALGGALRLLVLSVRPSRRRLRGRAVAAARAGARAVVDAALRGMRPDRARGAFRRRRERAWQRRAVRRIDIG